MGEHDVLDDGEAETGAAGFAGAGLVDAVEALEDAAEVLFGHARAEVLYVEFDGIFERARADDDAAAGGAVLHGVLDEVAEDLGHGIDVGEDEGVGGFAGFEGDAGFDDHAGQRLDGVVDQSGGADRLHAGLVLAGLDLGEREQVLSEAVHAAGVLEDDGHEFARVIGEVHAVFEERFDVAGDGSERRAQLMGDVGDEVAAGFLGALDFGDVVEDGDGSAIGSGRGADFEGAAWDD